MNPALHLLRETPLALELFADDYLTPAFLALGFHSAGDFVQLAQRFGVVPRRVQFLVGRFQEPARWQMAQDLVGRSFLCPQAQAVCHAILTDRQRALAT